MLVNGWKVCADWARAVGRFKPEGPDGYKAATMPDAPLRKTREEAIADEIEYRSWEFTAANKMISRISANGWRTPRDIDPSTYVPKASEPGTSTAYRMIAND